MIIDLIPLFREVFINVADESRTINYIEAYGIRGIPILMLLSFLQVVIFFIPAAPIQILSGLCYKVLIGTIIFIIGATIGNLVVFLIAKKLGDKYRLPKIKYLDPNKITKPELVVLILYLIPIIPNGLLPFVFAKTKITTVRYISLVALALIPSTLIASGLGHSISQGNYFTAIIIGIIMLLILGIALLFKNKLIAKFHN